MLNNLKKIILILPFITMLSCSESHTFSDKKNLNAALNDLFKGDFYSCNLIDDNDSESKKEGIQCFSFGLNDIKRSKILTYIIKKLSSHN